MNPSIWAWLSGPHIFEFDYVSQLQAVRQLLVNNEQAEAKLSEEIEDIQGWITAASRDEGDVAFVHTIELISESIYQQLAHSMAGVGVIAPVIEAVFKDAVRRAGEEVPLRNFVERLPEIIDRTGMSAYLPDEFAITMGALFQYRNKLFHWGFEWPADECERFQNAINKWPPGWFTVADLEMQQKVFIMSPTFIEHCVTTAEDVTKDLQDFLVDRARKENGLEPRGIGHRNMRLIDLPEWAYGWPG